MHSSITSITSMYLLLKTALMHDCEYLFPSEYFFLKISISCLSSLCDFLGSKGQNLSERSEIIVLFLIFSFIHNDQDLNLMTVISW